MYLIDANENTVASYEYDPYGNIVSATGTMAEINPLRYRGYYYDAELDMYYLQSRYYDPKICRFINADSYVSTGQEFVGFNMFAYCNNTPVNLVDREGMGPYSAFTFNDYRVVHNMVRDEVARYYGWKTEVYVKGSEGRGYLDLYDAKNHRYYEVKSIGAADTSRTNNQLRKYNNAYVEDWRYKWSAPRSLLQYGGTRFGRRTLKYGMYDITYKTDYRGIIVYSYELNYNRALRVLGFCAVTLLAVCTYGAASPLYAFCYC